MIRRRYVTWDETGAAIQLGIWRAKLEDADGNITRAGKLLGFTKSWAMKLTRLHSLNEYAALLRTKAGERVRGRPKSPANNVSIK